MLWGRVPSALSRSLDQVGGKGLFVKELENAMTDGRADLAVHSMKDVPAELPPGFVLAAISAREDPRDALVSNRFATLAEMPRGAVLGTSSLRRAAQVRERHPGLEVALLRGNVETRVAKLDRGEYDAIVLAVAGLVRLGLGPRIRSRLSLEESVPAPGQGALGIECLAARNDVQRILAQQRDHVEIEGHGRQVLRTRAAGSDPEEVGAQAARSLRDQGADAVLGALK